MARETRKQPQKSRLRIWGGVGLLLLAAVTTAMAGRKVREFALTDEQFHLSRSRAGALTVEGMKLTPRAKIQRVFATDFGRSIFAIPVDERRRRLLGIDWIEDASVSRVWPDRVVVRVRERTPVAFVSLRSGALLIDASGVLLDVPPQSHFTFPVLSGVREDSSESARRDQVGVFLQLQQELGASAKDISEVNVADLDNIRVVTRIDRQAVELMLGTSGFAPRYQNFLRHYSDIRRGSPGVTLFDLRLNNWITAKAKD